MARGQATILLRVLMDLALHEFILEVADILVKNLNYWVDVFLEDPWELLVVLVILRDACDLVAELLSPVVALEALVVFVEGDVIFELVEGGAVVVRIHSIDAQNIELFVLGVGVLYRVRER